MMTQIPSGPSFSLISIVKHLTASYLVSSSLTMSRSFFRPISLNRYIYIYIYIYISLYALLCVRYNVFQMLDSKPYHSVENLDN